MVLAHRTWTFIPLYVYGIIKQVGEIGELENRGLLIFASSIDIPFDCPPATDLHAPFQHVSWSSRDPHRVHVIIAKSVHAGIYIIDHASTFRIGDSTLQRGIKDGGRLWPSTQCITQLE